jgi:hypothetical protein
LMAFITALVTRRVSWKRHNWWAAYGQTLASTVG